MMTRNDGLVLGTTKVVDNGPRSLRFNLVIMGDGYQATEMANYASNVSQFVNTMLTTPPFDEVGNTINVYRVDVISTDSGADDPSTSSCAGSGTTARTYFDASFCTGGLRRALTVDNSTAVLTALSEVPEAHAVLVVVNSMIYGGTGGLVGTVSLAFGAEQIALHELGHTVFHLADEYESYRGCSSGETDHNNNPLIEPAAPNVTINTNLGHTKVATLYRSQYPDTHHLERRLYEMRPSAQPNPRTRGHSRAIRRREHLPLQGLSTRVQLQDEDAQCSLWKSLP